MSDPGDDHGPMIQTRPRTGAGRRIAVRLGVMIFFTAMLIEVSLRVVHLFEPLVMPLHEGANYDVILLEGRDGVDWRRLYVYRASEAATTAGHPIRVNKLGFRDHELIPRAKLGRPVVRILFLGDSFTAGEGLAEEKRFTSVLQRLIDTTYGPGRVEIINAGIPGFDAYQEARIVERVWKTADPDLVVLCFVGNDANIEYELFAPRRPDLPDWADRWLRKSLAVQVAEPWYDSLARHWSGIRPYEKVVEDSFDTRSEGWRVFEESIGGIAERVRSATGRAPWAMYLDAHDSSSRVYGMARAAYTRHGYVWLEREENRYRPQSRFDGHPDEATNAMYAEVIFRRLTADGELETIMASRENGP